MKKISKEQQLYLETIENSYRKLNMKYRNLKDSDYKKYVRTMKNLELIALRKKKEILIQLCESEEEIDQLNTQFDSYINSTKKLYSDIRKNIDKYEKDKTDLGFDLEL